MGDKRFLLGLFVIFIAMMTQAQEKKKFIPPNMTPKTYSFSLPELQIDSTFIVNLDSILFDRECRIMDLILSNPNENKEWRHFLLQFEEIDSLNYSILVMLENYPGRNSVGFSIHKEYYYWFGGEIPPNIILEKKSQKRFSYKDYSGLFTTDPPFWALRYNCQTGYIEIEEKPCF